MPVYKDKRRSDLASLMDTLVAFDRDKIVRHDLSDLGFQSVEEEIDRIRRVAVRLRACDLDLLPDNKLQECQNFTTAARDLFGRMQSFSPMRSNQAPQMERDNIAQQVRNLYPGAAERLTDVFALSSPTLQETNEEVRLIIDAAKSSANSVLEGVQSEATKAQKEVEAVLVAVRQASGYIGIEKQAEVFRNAAAEHAKSRKNWLIATVILAVFTAVALVTNWIAVYHLSQPTTALSLAQLSIAKVLIFTFLLSAVIWSGKVYRSHQHNYVLNKHRQNALETFQLFAKGAEDSDTKSMVLLQATRCIFAPQPTGFLSGDRETDGDGPQILEVIRNLSAANK